jgi:hypothetical protein
MPALIRLSDLQSVQPLSKPSGHLHYIDFFYETISEKRKKKLNEIFPEFKNENKK